MSRRKEPRPRRFQPRSLILVVRGHQISLNSATRSTATKPWRRRKRKLQKLARRAQR